MPNMSTTLVRNLLILPLLAATLCAAADKPAKKEGSFGTPKASGAYLTKDQLRACLSRQEKIKVLDADLLREQAAIAAQKAEIARLGDALKATLESLDRTSAQAVADYNEAAAARDAQIDAYQARVTAFNAGVEAGQREHEGFAQGCSSRRYFEDDEIAIRKGR